MWIEIDADWMGAFEIEVEGATIECGGELEGDTNNQELRLPPSARPVFEDFGQLAAGCVAQICRAPRITDLTIVD